MENNLNVHDVFGRLVKHKRLQDVCLAFSEGILKLHPLNKSLHNHIFEYSKLNTLNLLMVYIYTNKIETLSKFYELCSKYTYSGKNRSLAILDYMVFSGNISFNKISDRRKKKPVLTEKGLAVLDKVTLAVYPSLVIFDEQLPAEINLNPNDRNKYYSHFYKLTPKHTCLEGTQDYLLKVVWKTAGTIFILKVYVDLIKGAIKLDEPTRASYFINISADLGVSQSHINNIMKIIVDGGGAFKNGRYYLVKSSFKEDVECFISSYLSTVYVCTKTQQNES